MYTDHTHKSERLVYEAIDPEQDIDWYQKLRSDPSVAQFLVPFVVSPWSRAKAAKYLVSERAIIQVAIKVTNKEDPSSPATPIGFMRLNGPGPGLEHHRRAEFVLALMPSFHGHGYGSEALRWLLEAGFRRANLHRIEGWYLSNNLPAAKCYEKLGFKIEGVARENTWSDGEWLNLMAIAILRSEWEEQQREKGRRSVQLQSV